MPGPRPQVGEGQHPVVPFDDRDGKATDVLLVEKAERESLFRSAPAAEPIVGHLSKLRQQGGNFVGWDDAKACALLLWPPQRLPEARRLAALPREGRQIDARFLAQLHERQTEIGVVVQMLASHFVEGRRAAIVGAALEKSANQQRNAIWRANRITHDGPGPPLDAVHHKAALRLVEPQRLVAQIDEKWKRAGLRPDHLAGHFELFAAS